jgi:hypothetical protein
MGLNTHIIRRWPGSWCLNSTAEKQSRGGGGVRDGGVCGRTWPNSSTKGWRIVVMGVVLEDIRTLSNSMSRDDSDIMVQRVVL